MRSVSAFAIFAVALVMGAVPAWAGEAFAAGVPQDSEYRIRARDALIIAVDDAPTLTGEFVVDADGALELPLVGHFPVANLTADQAAQELTRQLEKFFSHPRVSLTVRYTQQVQIFGAVKSPGVYPLSGPMTLLELLARAGYQGPSEVLVVGRHADGSPATESGAASDADVVRVNMRDLERNVERGDLSGNIRLKDGDTLFVPGTDPSRVFVSGAVRKPGPYSVADGTTVLQALTVAGGPTERAAVANLRIVRIVDKRLERLRAKLSDPIQPGDTINVPESVRIDEVVSNALSTTNRLPMEWRLGHWLTVNPGLALHGIGINTDALNDRTDIPNDIAVWGGPDLDARANLGRLRLQGSGGVDFVYFRRYADDGTIDPRGNIQGDLTPFRALTLFGSFSYENTRDRYSSEVDVNVRPRRLIEAADAGVRVRLSRLLSVSVAGHEWSNEFTNSTIYQGVDLQQTLTERIRGGTATVRYTMTPLSELFVEGREARHNYTYQPFKDADETEISVGGSFKPTAVISGEADAGYLHYAPLSANFPAYQGPVARVDLEAHVNDKTTLGAGGGRSEGTTYRNDVPYAIVDRIGGSIRRTIVGRWDILLETYREVYRYTSFTVASADATRLTWSEPAQRYTVQLGLAVSGGARVALDASYWQQLAPFVVGLSSTNGNPALLVSLKVTYGAVRAQSAPRAGA